MVAKDALPTLIDIVKQATINCTGIQQTIDTMEGVEEQYNQFQELTAKDIYHVGPVTIASNILAIEAAKLMEQKDISQIIVADQQDYIGIIHIHDLMKEGII